MIRRILCPTDFSPTARHALLCAARLAAQLDAELVVLHAWYVPASRYTGTLLPDDLVSGVRQDAERALANSVEEAARAGAPRVASKLVRAVPWAAIVDTLAQESFDLCLMGTHGRTGASRFLLGSVAEKVIRHAPVSVLAIRPEIDLDGIGHVLCPTDFSSSADHALELATWLVRPGGTVTLLHVIELPLATPGEIAQPALAELLDHGATEALAERAAQMRSARHEVVTRSRVGSPAGQILSALEEDRSVDLVVMGSHGRTGLTRALLGSVAEKVVRHARCAVLVAKPSTHASAGAGGVRAARSRVKL